MVIRDAPIPRKWWDNVMCFTYDSAVHSNIHGDGMVHFDNSIIFCSDDDYELKCEKYDSRV